MLNVPTPTIVVNIILQSRGKSIIQYNKHFYEQRAGNYYNVTM